MRVNDRSHLNCNIYGLRIENLISSLSERTRFDRLKLFASKPYVPPIISLKGNKETVLFLNKDYIQFDINNRPYKILLDYSLKNAAIAVKNKHDFGHRAILAHTECFTYLYDLRSKYFLISDIDTGMSHKLLENGFKILKAYKMINSDLDVMMKGAFEFSASGDIGIVVATFQNPFPGLALNTALIRRSFFELGQGLRTLGCSEKIFVCDYAVPTGPLQRYLKNSGVSTLSDVLKKFAP